MAKARFPGTKEPHMREFTFYIEGLGRDSDKEAAHCIKLDTECVDGKIITGAAQVQV